MADINVTVSRPVVQVTLSLPAPLEISTPGTQGVSGAVALAAHVAAANPHPQYRLNDLGKTFAYNPDGSLLSVTDAYGSKTFTYNPDGSLASIAGTGVYQSKEFSYNPDGSLTYTTVS